MTNPQEDTPSTTKPMAWETSSQLPSKAPPPNGTTYNKIISSWGSKMQDFMIHPMLSASPFTPGNIYHENGSGPGPATIALMSLSPPPGVRFIATDISPSMTEPLEVLTEEKNWPVEIYSDMSATSLRFEDNTFSGSISSLLILNTPEKRIPACSEIYRTLKPDSIAVINCFQTLPHWTPFKSTMEKYKPVRSKTLPWTMVQDWSDGSLLTIALKTAGFKEENIEMKGFKIWTEIEGDGMGIARDMWGTMGGMAGWKFPEDEERWDDAVGHLAKGLRDMPECEGLEGGREGWRYECCFHVAFARK